MSDELQTSIAMAIDREFFYMSGGTPHEIADHADAGPGPGDMQLAWAVLNTPEMLAIKAALAMCWDEGDWFRWDWAPATEFPESVINWMNS